jgi:hypothetical protein
MLLIPLTIDLIYKIYGKYKNYGKKIYFYTEQLYDGLDINSKQPSIKQFDKKDINLGWFIPNGDLIKIEDDLVEILDKWLYNYKKGPYKKIDKGKSKKIKYYLSGIGYFLGNSFSKIEITSGPLNTLSMNAIDEMTCLIPKSYKLKTILE